MCLGGGNNYLMAVLGNWVLYTLYVCNKSCHQWCVDTTSMDDLVECFVDIQCENMAVIWTQILINSNLMLLGHWKYPLRLAGGGCYPDLLIWIIISIIVICALGWTNVVSVLAKVR